MLDAFEPFYSGEDVERMQFLNRVFGAYWFIYAGMIFCNCLFPLVLCFGAVRRNHAAVAVVAVASIVGMWLERFNIVELSLMRTHSTVRLGLATRPRSGIGSCSAARWGCSAPGCCSRCAWSRSCRCTRCASCSRRRGRGHDPGDVGGRGRPVPGAAPAPRGTDRHARDLHAGTAAGTSHGVADPADHPVGRAAQCGREFRLADLLLHGGLPVRRSAAGRNSPGRRSSLPFSRTRCWSRSRPGSWPSS